MPSSRERSAALRSAAAHVFVDDVDGPVLAEPDAHHLARVLRLRAGETVSVSDGAGSWRLCSFVGGGPQVDPLGEVHLAPAPSPRVSVGFALTKGDRPEFAVQKLTELGVDVIVPFVAERSVVRWDPDKSARNMERLVRVAREASMQSRRVWLPEVRPVAGSLAEAAAGCGGDAVLAEPGGSRVRFTESCVFVGPEGGWSPEELSLASANFSLGSTILRAETATLAVGVALCALRDEIVGNHDG